MIHYDPRWSGPHGIGRFSDEVTARLPDARPLQVGARRLSLLDPLATTWAVRGLRDGVYFTPGFNPPLRSPIPFVFCIHDLIHLRFAAESSVLRRAYYGLVVGPAARRAARVLTVSEYSRREILEYLSVPEQRVHAIVPGIDRLAVKTSAYGEARVLYVGSIFNRRHVPDLIRAISTLRRTRPDLSLDIVGDDRTFPRERLDLAIANQRLEGHVRWHRYVSNERLLELYGHARAFAFLSEYEGLGMTPLEALGAGVPPVVYDTAVARESYADAALYVPVGDGAGIVRALERALFDEQTRAAILAAAPAALAKYDWPRAARETLTVIENAAKSG